RADAETMLYPSAKGGAIYETNKIHSRLSIKLKAALERIKGEEPLVERSRASGVHPNPLWKGKLPLLTKGAERFEPPNNERIPEAPP
ncbi:hypothetical protein AB1399_02380, partial [Hydrogenibacillus schlegelii]|uniref:hypothetical protein n=1 Tax=Hydrogenibacillus schlegelii TaxID=1484 RepID=UPI0034A021D9